MTETTDHPIRLRNTLTRRVERFVPADPKNVRMYVCGPTVYDRAHLGNARSAVVFDVLFRLLRHVYGEEHVTYVRNITDIDDKIIARARETGRSVEAITEETIRWYHEDMDALGCLRPTFEPRATEYLPQMIAMIAALIERGHAYEAEGHVLFAVESYRDYGRLSGRSTEDMIAGARVEVAPYKRHPMDFVLWKPSAEGVPGWASPWGLGRPGWHIECSAMARDLLGGSFDIHGGGLDLQFPHHENEIAQSRCAHPDEGFARVWVHNEMLRVEGEKMSKSLGNFFTVRDLLDRGVPGEVMRLVLLGTHYGKPLDWTDQKVRSAHAKLGGWRSNIIGVAHAELYNSFLAAVADDLNTHEAIQILSELDANDQWHLLASSGQLLNLLSNEMGEWWQHEQEQELAGALDVLLEMRREARSSRNFLRADKIRDLLSEVGIELQDVAGNKVRPSVDALRAADWLVQKSKEGALNLEGSKVVTERGGIDLAEAVTLYQELHAQRILEAIK